MNLEHANLGVNTSHVLQFSVAPDLNGSTPAQTLAFADRARGEIAALPGVRSVSISTTEIFAGDDSSSNFTPEGYRPGDDTDAMYDYIGPNYFSTMGRSEEHTSELQSLTNLVCRLLLEKKKKINTISD